LVKLIIERFVAETGEDAAACEYDEEYLLDVRLKAEDAKKSLTRRESIQQRLSWESHKASVTITREEFESATKHLVDQTVEISRRTVERAQQKVSGLDVDKVVLVGGSSRMPMIAEALRNDMGSEPVTTASDLAAAKGAAIYGPAQIEEIRSYDGDAPANRSGEKKLALGGAHSLNVKNVLARSLGIDFLLDGSDEEKSINDSAHA